MEPAPGRPWTVASCEWLKGLLESALPDGASAGLASLLRNLEWLWSETERLDALILALSRTAPYALLASSSCWRKGVGVLTAMV